MRAHTPAHTPAHAPAHIAMFSIAAHGHVNPSIEIIRELVARGHRVTYAVPPSFADRVARTGAEPRTYTSTLPSDGDDPAAWGAEPIDHFELFLGEAVQALPQLVTAYEGDRPDLVLGDIAAYPSRVLAHRWNVPHLQLSPCMVAWEGYEEEVAAPMMEPIRRSERGKAYHARFSAWLADNGLDMDPDHFLGRPDHSLVLIPRALQPQADRVDPARYTFVGACQGERTDQGSWTRPAGAERVLLVSLGSAFTRQPAFYRACVEAFGGLPGWHVVLQIGAHVRPEELGEVPPNIEVRPWVPQLAVLRQADVFVTHAGAGGSQEGLATATPMVAVPQAADQCGNAAVLESLGVARHLPTQEATPRALREAVLALAVDPEVALRSSELATQVRSEGGTRLAADLIEARLPARD